MFVKRSYNFDNKGRKFLSGCRKYLDYELNAKNTINLAFAKPLRFINDNLKGFCNYKYKEDKNEKFFKERRLITYINK